MATITKEVEFEFDEVDAVNALSADDLINALVDIRGVDAVLDGIHNEEIVEYLEQYDIVVITNDDEFNDAAVSAVISNAALLERVLRAAPVSALAEVLENMGGAV